MIEKTLELPEGFLKKYKLPEFDVMSFLDRAKGWLKGRF